MRLEPDVHELASALPTLAVAACGALAATAIGFPAPFLTGPAAAVAIANLAGLSCRLPNVLAATALVLIGMNIGAGVTPEVFETARRWPFSFVMLALSLVAIMSGSSLWLRRSRGYDRATALLTSAPGHLTFVMGLSTETNADIRRVALVQTLRVLTLTLIVPIFVSLFGAAPSTAAADITVMSPAVIVVVFLLSVAIGRGLRKLKVPAALLIGAMLVSTAGHLTGIVEGAMPGWLAVPAFLIMGAMIGARFSGVTPAMLKQSLFAGVGVTVIAMTLAGMCAVVVIGMFDLPAGQVLIAFMPGGVEAMIAMAVILDADPTFVAAHHVARLFMLTFLVPLMLGRQA